MFYDGGGQAVGSNGDTGINGAKKGFASLREALPRCGKLLCAQGEYCPRFGSRKDSAARGGGLAQPFDKAQGKPRPPLPIYMQ